MAWYHWIATYLLIIAAFAFWIVPVKPWWFILLIVVVGLIALSLMRYLPPKTNEEYPYGKERPRLKLFATILWYAFGAYALIYLLFF